MVSFYYSSTTTLKSFYANTPPTSLQGRGLPVVRQIIFGQKLLCQVRAPTLGQNRQKILGGLLWLSTRTRPDLSYSISSASKDIGTLKAKLRHSGNFNSTSTLLKLLDYFTHTLGKERRLTYCLQ